MTRRLRQLAWIFLALLFLAALFSDRIAGASYAHQFRDFPGAPVSWRFPLGTDALGRDRLARLLTATRISLLLAPAAALFSTVLATLIAGFAGYRGGRLDRFVMRAIDLMLSLPWIFLLIAARALLPLNVSPAASLLVTFALLGVLGWAGPGAGHPRWSPRFARFRFHAASARLRLPGLPPAAAPTCAQSEICTARTILDVHSAFYSERSQSRTAGVGRIRSAAFVGKSAA